MKIRIGFVSNSSSSSFIIKENMNKVKDLINNCYSYDYYVYKDTLYTSFIPNDSSIHSKIQILSDGEVKGDFGGPYDEDGIISDFIEIEGELEIDSVYIQKERLSMEELNELTKLSNNTLPSISKRITNMVSDFINNHSDLSEEALLEAISTIIYQNNIKYLRKLQQEIDRGYRLLEVAHDTVTAIISHPDVPESEDLRKLINDFRLKTDAIESEYDLDCDIEEDDNED